MSRLDVVGESQPDDVDVVSLFEQYARSGDRELRNELIVRHHWLAEHCARRFARRNVPLDDLVQVAQVGLLKAVERFDPDHGVGFASFAIPTVLGELRRHFRDATWAVKVSRHHKERSLEIGAISGDLTQQLGREPTVDDIAARLGLPAGEIAESMVAGTAYRARSLDRPLLGESTDGGLTDVKDLLGIDEGTTTANGVAVRAALVSLPERERTVVFLRFFEDLTQQEIADVVGVSQVHVSRLLRSALVRLRSTVDQDGG